MFSGFVLTEPLEREEEEEIVPPDRVLPLTDPARDFFGGITGSSKLVSSIARFTFACTEQAHLSKHAQSRISCAWELISKEQGPYS